MKIPIKTGLRPDREVGPAFAPGHFIEAIEADGAAAYHPAGHSSTQRTASRINEPTPVDHRVADRPDHSAPNCRHDTGRGDNTATTSTAIARYAEQTLLPSSGLDRPNGIAVDGRGTV